VRVRDKKYAASGGSLVMKWWLYNEQDEPNRSDLPALQVVIFTLIVVIICVVIRALTWPGDKHVDSTFFSQSIAVPATICLALGCFCMTAISSNRHYDECRLEIAKKRKNELKIYANHNVIIAGWAALTPVDELALSMLKLEGEFPLAPKTPLKIPRQEDFEFTANEQLFYRLLTPLIEKLKSSYYPSFEAALWVRGGDASCTEDLRRAFERLGLESDRIEYLLTCPGYSLLNDWIDKAQGYVLNRLLVIVDMHDEEGDPKAMENATALLLTSHYRKTEGEKPVYLYRPITSITDVEITLPVYLQVKPVSAPKTLWYTGLSKVEKYPLMQGFDEAKLVANRLELETSFGDKSAGYRWLALALAADAVKYAQGDQLIAASDSNRLDIIPLSSRLTDPFTESLFVDYAQPWHWSGLMGVFIAFALVFGPTAFTDAAAKSDESGGMALFFLITPIVVFLGLGIALTRYISKKASEHMGGY